MTQRIFNVKNEKDYADLWDIIPESIVKIRKGYKSKDGYYYNFYDTKYIEGFYETAFLIINWHDKTEITRPIQECTEQDFGKICVFWNFAEKPIVSILLGFNDDAESEYPFVSQKKLEAYRHCRRLTKQEIEELC